MAFSRDDMAAYEQQTQEMVEISPGTVEVAADAPPAEPATEEATPATEGAETATETADGGSSADDAEGEPATPSGEPSAATDAPQKGSARARIMELVDERNAYKKFGTVAEQRIADLEAKLAAVERGKPVAPATEPPAATTETSTDDDPPPSPDDEDVQYDPVKLQQKNAKWIKAQVNKGVKAGVAEALGADKAVTAQAQAKAAFEARVDAFEKTPEGKDFRARIGNTQLPTLALPARQLIGRDDMGPAILNHIASDVAAATELAKLPVEVQVMRIGEIKAELKLAAKATPAAGETKPAVPTAKPVKQPKTVSSAPPPPTRVPAGSTTNTDKSMLDPSMSMEEWVKRDREATTAARIAKREARLGRH